MTHIVLPSWDQITCTTFNQKLVLTCIQRRYIVHLLSMIVWINMCTSTPYKIRHAVFYLLYIDLWPIICITTRLRLVLMMECKVAIIWPLDSFCPLIRWSKFLANIIHLSAQQPWNKSVGNMINRQQFKPHFMKLNMRPSRIAATSTKSCIECVISIITINIFLAQTLTWMINVCPKITKYKRNNCS